jgi:hypothetical protein
MLLIWESWSSVVTAAAAAVESTPRCLAASSGFSMLRVFFVNTGGNGCASLLGRPIFPGRPSSYIFILSSYFLSFYLSSHASFSRSPPTLRFPARASFFRVRRGFSFPARVEAHTFSLASIPKRKGRKREN